MKAFYYASCISNLQEELSEKIDESEMSKEELFIASKLKKSLSIAQSMLNILDEYWENCNMTEDNIKEYFDEALYDYSQQTSTTIRKDKNFLV